MFKVLVENYLGHPHGNFSMKFGNGYTVSLAFGDGTYSHGNLDEGFTSIEVAAWDAEGNWVMLDKERDSTVAGWKSPDQLLGILNKVASL